MSISSFMYLAVAGLLAFAVLFVVIRLMPRLLSPSPTSTHTEMLVIGLILAVGLVAIYGSFYFGNAYFAYHDVGSDTAEQYVPYYLSMIHALRDGTFGTWNHEFGLGVSFMSYQSWTLDPFNVVMVPLVLLLGDTSLGPVLVFVQSLKIVLCALLFERLLLRYCEVPLSRVFGACTFAFCGYLMLWGQHYWLGTVLVMAVLITVLLERLMETWTAPRFVAVMLATAASVMMSTYSGFMVMLYAAVYAAIRLIHVSNCKTPAQWLKRFVPLAIPVICGLLISMLTLVPYATLMLGESSRVTGGDSSLATRIAGSFSFVPLAWIPAILSRVLGSALLSSGADIPSSVIAAAESFPYVNVYEFIQLGFGVGTFILLGQFIHWLITDAEKRDRPLIIVSALLCLMYCFNFFLPALSNVFVDPKYRSAFALAIPVCLALAIGFEKRVVLGKIARLPLFASFVLTFAVLAWSLLKTVNGRWLCVFYLLVAATLLALLALKGSSRTKSNIYLALICACMLSASVADAFFVTNQRAASDAERFPLASEPNHADDTMEALSWLADRDTTAYRVEKLYTDWTRLDDALVQGYMGVASYNSTLDSDVEEFYQKLWPNMLVGDSAYQEFVNDPEHPGLLQLLGVKYLLSHDQLTFDWCVEIASFGDVHVYQLAPAGTMASVRSGAISESEASNLSPEQREELLAACNIVPDEVASRLSEDAMTSQHHASIANVPAGVGDIPPLDTDIQAPDPTGATVGNPINIGVDAGAEPGTTIFDSPTPPVFTREGASRMTGTIEVTNDSSSVCLAIPHTSGWTITVDGDDVETYRANYGFIGFTASAGTHTVVAEFHPRGVSTGIACAAAGIVAATAYCTWRRNGSKR